MKKRKKQQKSFRLKTNRFGNVDGVPSGWMQTTYSPSKIEECGVPYYMALTGFRCGRNGRVPVVVPIIPRQFVGVLFKHFSGFKPNRRISVELRQEGWEIRLNKFTGCGMELAHAIACAKLEYKNHAIRTLETRQEEHYSKMRAQLLEYIRRENPLRRIKDADHARAIIRAYHRHTNTDYDKKLDEMREYAKYGLIDKKRIRDYARHAAMEQEWTNLNQPGE